MSIDGTNFTFPGSWTVSIFDEWPQFRKLAGPLGIQGVDIVAIDGSTLWLIEMKDYTYPGAKAPEELPMTLGRKAIGTMAVLFALGRSTSDSEAHDFALNCQSANEIILALHIEVKDGGRKAAQVEPLLMPLQSEIRKMQKLLGLAKSWVTSTLAPNGNTPWTATRMPNTRSAHADR